MIFGRRRAPSSTPVALSTADATHREEDLSPQVKDFALFALAHGVDCVPDGGGSMPPFVMVETGAGKSLVRFVGVDDPLPAMRNHVAASGGVRAAMVWDGYLTDEGERRDAIFVEASDAGCGSIVLAHRYAQSGTGAQVIGRPMLISLGQPIL